MEDNKLNGKIEETMSSLDNIQRAQSNPFLLTRVLSRMENRVVSKVNPVVIWRVAASLALILTLNIAINIYYKKNSRDAMEETRLDQTYFINNAYSY